MFNGDAGLEEMETILCAVDLSPATQVVVAWAHLFARQLNARLHLFHAVHTPSDTLHPTTEFERGGALQQRRESSRRQIEQVMAGVDVPWQAEIAFGEPAEMLQQFCHTQSVDLVIARIKGLRGFKRLLYGTVVERMARMVNCPLLALQPTADATTKLDRIGICCDMTKGSRLLIDYGLRLAHAFKTELYLLHAMETPLAPDLVEPTGAPYEQVQQALRVRLQGELLSMVPEKERDALGVSVHMVPGQAQESIPELAGGLNIDLVLVGVRPHSAIGKWVVGSTTEALLREARSQVLTVPVRS